MNIILYTWLIVVGTVIGISSWIRESVVDMPSTNPALADTVYIEQADRITRTVRDGLPVQELEGSVRLRQNETLLRARKVTRFLTRDEIILNGNVVIIKETDSLFADNARYDTERKIGHATGNVRLSDGEVEVFSPSAIHYTDEKRTFFDEAVRLIDSLTVLSSLKGEYFSEPKRAEFFGNVVLEEDQTYLEADSVTYFRETEIAFGYGQVFIERVGGTDDVQRDSTTRTFLFGDYVYNDNRNEYSLIEGNAFLFQIQSDSSGAFTDSLLIEASRLEASNVDSFRQLIAVDSVKIWRDSFSAVADSIVYDRITMENTPVFEENRLYRDPMAWYDEYQLSGDSLRATAVDGNIDSLFAYQNAFVAFFDSTTGKINQLKGGFLLGLFEQDSLKSLAVGPQAESIYFQEGDNGQIGATKTSGDRIHLSFKNNELSNIKAYSGIKGEYYDGGLIPEPFELMGFKWMSSIRPIKSTMLEEGFRENKIKERLESEGEPEKSDTETQPVVSTQSVRTGEP